LENSKAPSIRLIAHSATWLLEARGNRVILQEYNGGHELFFNGEGQLLEMPLISLLEKTAEKTKTPGLER